MNREDIINKLSEVFGQIFSKIPSNLEEAEPENIDEWDSLKHVILIDAIEKKFEIKFDLNDMLNMNSMKEIIKGIEQKIK